MLYGKSKAKHGLIFWKDWSHMALVSQPLGCDQNFRLIYFLKIGARGEKKSTKMVLKAIKNAL